MDPKWREEREVKNPEVKNLFKNKLIFIYFQWILWFWAPIVFVMYVLTRFLWTLLLDNQGVEYSLNYFYSIFLGINFPNVVNAAESVTIENDGISEIDEDRLHERLNVIAENFRTAHSTRAFSGENIY